ncbi:hypothetical protein D3C73_647380 [compost metagenome]
MRRRGVEASVGAHAQGDLLADLRLLRQPARGQARRPVRPRHQADAELEPPVRGQGGDRIFAAARLFAVARGQADLGDVARRPVGRVVDGFEGQMPGLAAGAAGVEQGPLDQAPAVIGGRGPVGGGGRAGDQVQLMLPVAHGARIAIVDLDPVEQGLRPAAVQPVADRVAEAAEGVIGPVAQRHQPIGQVRQVRLRAHDLAHEAGGAVGGVALAGGRGHDQQAPRALQRLQIQLGEGQDPRADAAVAQGARGHPGQLLAEAGLAGEGDQRGLVARRHGEGAGLLGGPARRGAHAPDGQGDQPQPQQDGDAGAQPAGQVGGHLRRPRRPSWRRRRGSSARPGRAGCVRRNGRPGPSPRPTPAPRTAPARSGRWPGRRRAWPRRRRR